MPPGLWKSRANTRWRFVQSALSTWKRKRESTKGGTNKNVVYNRLFTKILDSSIWLEPDSTRIVWITLLASMNQDGYAHFSALENLATRAHVSLSKAQRAIEILEAPDPNSENVSNEGRRIERVPGGWIVLNAIHYRERFSKEIEREQTRLRVQKYRAKKAGNALPNVTSRDVTVVPASASVHASVSSSGRCTEEEAIQYCTAAGLTKEDGQWFWNKGEGCGWKNNGKAIKDWKKTVTAWRLIHIFPSQKQTRKVSAALPAPTSWGDRKAQKQMIDELQEQKNEMFKRKQREARQFTSDEQAKYNALAKRLEQLKAL